MRSVSIVLPVPRVAPAAVDLFHRYLAASRELQIEIQLIVVTANGPATAIASDVEIVELKPWAWGRAVRHGLAIASGDVVGYTNPHRTSPDTVRLMLAYALTYDGVVLKANRRTRDSVVQRIGSLLYNLECWRLFDLTSWDVNGTPKIFPRGCSRLFELTRDDDLIDAEFMLVCQRENYPVLEIPIEALPQEWDWPTTRVRDALRMYIEAVRFWRDLRASHP